jgi:hypothetical protein
MLAHISFVVVLPLLPVIATRAECARSVLHGDHDRARGQILGRRVAGFDDEAGGTARHSVREEAVRVVILTSNRDEKLVRLERPGVDRDAAKVRGFAPPEQLAARPTDGVARAEANPHEIPRRRSARIASVRSSKGRRSRPTI